MNDAISSTLKVREKTDQFWRNCKYKKKKTLTHVFYKIQEFRKKKKKQIKKIKTLDHIFRPNGRVKNTMSHSSFRICETNAHVRDPLQIL